MLAAGGFAVGTSAFVVSGVLPAVSAELDVSLSTAGQLATAFALSSAVGAPLMATLTRRWERRTLLIAALLLAALGDLIAAAAPNYVTLLAGRIVAALGVATYTPAASLFATGLLPPQLRGRALAVVFGGLTFALALGVPAGSLLSDAVGYRPVFALLATVSLLAATAVRAVLPRLDAPPTADPRVRSAGSVVDRRAQVVLAMTVLSVLATMSVYTYVVPLLERTAHLTGTVVGALLLLYGAGAVLGNWLGGHATDRFGSLRTLLVALAGFTLASATLPLTAVSVGGAALALFVWSTFTWAFNPAAQDLLLPPGSNGGLLLALNGSAIYLATAVAAIVGGVVIQLLSIQLLPLLAAALGAAALGLLLALRGDPRRRAADG